MKRITVPVAALTLAFALAACGDKTEQASSIQTPENDAAETTTEPVLAPTPNMFYEGYGGNDGEYSEGRVLGIISDGTKGSLEFTYNVDDTFCKVGGGLSTSDNSPITGVVKDPDGTVVATAKSRLGHWNTDTKTCDVAVWSDRGTLIDEMDFYTMELVGPNGTTFQGTSDTPLIELQKTG